MASRPTSLARFVMRFVDDAHDRTTPAPPLLSAITPPIKPEHYATGAPCLMISKLDAIDWRILKELQADGRLTNVALAARVGITPPPCLRRVRALEEGGYIAGYHATVDEVRLGFTVTAYAMVGLYSQSEADLRAFENRVLSWPLVRACDYLAGETDFMLRCVAPDLFAFQEFVTRELTAAPNVATVKTFVSIRSVKREPGVPMGQLRKG